ncbi:hypothetical protein L1787_06815 [Acuticoccus sp. M5D2P5]|uniref:TPM domain-containing protein n=1 Tax=Acuticoccus kalidii TaxID=2910977 RepID=UPI001F1C6269|nr:hypothetical protein [Acuticoccus kalidii]MCF3933126.1 hypothetical protein [Acuticoccus kalidii]
MVSANAADHAAVADAIRAAEATTAGEIFCVVAGQSDDYRLYPAIWALLAALTVPTVLLVLGETSAPTLVLTQLLTALVLLPLSQFSSLRIHLVPRAVRRARAHLKAVDLFLAHNIHATPNRTGVLIFVSLFEHHAEIVADRAIYEAVSEETWEALIERLILQLKAGALTEGLVEAIGEAGTILAEHVPPDPGGVADHLPNTLVVI